MDTFVSPLPAVFLLMSSSQPVYFHNLNFFFVIMTSILPIFFIIYLFLVGYYCFFSYCLSTSVNIIINTIY